MAAVAAGAEAFAADRQVVLEEEAASAEADAAVPAWAAEEISAVQGAETWEATLAVSPVVSGHPDKDLFPEAWEVDAARREGRCSCRP